jgi:hypothetical protein
MIIKKEISMGAADANIKSMIFVFPVLIVFGLPFILIWGKNPLNAVSMNHSMSILVSWIFIILGIIFHELIHGISWSLFLKDGFKSIKFGILWNFLTPYCHCKVPLKRKHYIIGTIMPAVLLGIIPSIISIATGNSGLFLFGIFFSITAGGDLLLLWFLRKEKKDVWIQDLSDKVGYIIFEKGEEAPIS